MPFGDAISSISISLGLSSEMAPLILGNGAGGAATSDVIVVDAIGVLQLLLFEIPDEGVAVRGDATVIEPTDVDLIEVFIQTIGAKSTFGRGWRGGGFGLLFGIVVVGATLEVDDTPVAAANMAVFILGFTFDAVVTTFGFLTADTCVCSGNAYGSCIGCTVLWDDGGNKLLLNIDAG